MSAEDRMEMETLSQFSPSPVDPEELERQQRDEEREQEEQLREAQRRNEREIQAAREDLEKYVAWAREQLLEDPKISSHLTPEEKKHVTEVLSDAVTFLAERIEATKAELDAKHTEVQSVCDPLVNQILAAVTADAMRVEARNNFEKRVGTLRHKLEDPDSYGSIDGGDTNLMGLLKLVNEAERWVATHRDIADHEDFKAVHDEFETGVTPFVAALDALVEQHKAEQKEIIEQYEAAESYIASIMNLVNNKLANDMSPDDRRQITDTLNEGLQWLQLHKGTLTKAELAAKLEELHRSTDPIIGRVESDSAKVRQERTQEEMRKRKEAKEKLQALITDSLAQVHDPEKLATRITSEDAEKIEVACNDTQFWLDGKGATASSGEFEQQIQTLESVVEPIISAALKAIQEEKETKEARQALESAQFTLDAQLGDLSGACCVSRFYFILFGEMTLPSFAITTILVAAYLDSSRQTLQKALEESRQRLAQNRTTLSKSDLVEQLRQLNALAVPIIQSASTKKEAGEQQKKQVLLGELQEYIEHTQEALTNDDKIAAVITPEERAAGTAALQRAKDWIETSASNATRREIDDKQGELQDVCAPLLDSLYKRMEEKKPRSTFGLPVSPRPVGAPEQPAPSANQEAPQQEAASDAAGTISISSSVGLILFFIIISSCSGSSSQISLRSQGEEKM